MKQMLTYLAGCLLVTNALAGGLLPSHADLSQCQQVQTLPGKNPLTRDEQAKLAAHLDMLAEQNLQPSPLSLGTHPADHALSKAGHYTTHRPRQGDELS